jgi:hypothetical protein
MRQPDRVAGAAAENDDLVPIRGETAHQRPADQARPSSDHNTHATASCEKSDQDLFIRSGKKTPLLRPGDQSPACLQPKAIFDESGVSFILRHTAQTMNRGPRGRTIEARGIHSRCMSLTGVFLSLLSKYDFHDNILIK